MSPSNTPDQDTQAGKDLQRETLLQANAARTGILREYFAFILQNKKWWLIPIIISLLVLAGFVILGSTSVGPLIYAMF